VKKLRFRQIHLDFHTSELIEGIGVEFDPDDFARTLKKNHINSITCFAKCHHGMSYYQTKVGIKHPYLKRDLLKEMIAACHAEDIRVPAYISVCFDEYMAGEHPEWRRVDSEGKMGGAGPLQAGWHILCLNSDYADYVAQQTEEVLRNYESDGIFFDIVGHPDDGCFCRRCVRDRDELHLDSESKEDLKKHKEIVLQRFRNRLYNLVRSIKPEVSVFFNGSIQIGMRDSLRDLTHLEIESLPSGGWGYSHFPFFVRYCRTLNKEFLGMTARFHKSWADFGSLKNKAALEYECFSMLANGAKCSIGDQLHPRGRLNKSAYERIGKVYKSVAEKEPWCVEAKPVAQIGVVSVASQKHVSVDGIHSSDEGAMRMLLETHHQFDILDLEADFSGYELLILPDSISISPAIRKKLNTFLKAGGHLVLSYESGLNQEREDFVLPEMGAEYIGRDEYSPNYFQVKEMISDRIPDMPHIMYEGSLKIKPLEGTEVLATVMYPYFNRTYKHFSSHFQTPVEKSAKFPAVTRRGEVIYISSPIFRAYKLHGYIVYRQLLENLLDLLLPKKLVKADLPSTCQVTVMQQKDRRIVHLLHYIPERRVDGLDIVEDTIPLYNLRVSVHTGDWSPAKVYLAPGAIPVEFEPEGEYISCLIPRLDGHGMLVLER